MRMTARIVGVGVLALVAITPAYAQGGAAQPPAPNHVISASPLLMMFKWFNVDYERRIGPAVTLGASGSHLASGDDYQRATFHARYYPQGAAFTGFYIGAQTGIHRTLARRERRISLGAGMDLGYAWLLGPNRNHSVSIGFGTTRMLNGDADGYSLMVPNVRLLNVGFAF